MRVYSSGSGNNDDDDDDAPSSVSGGTGGDGGGYAALDDGTMHNTASALFGTQTMVPSIVVEDAAPCQLCELVGYDPWTVTNTRDSGLLGA